MDFGTIGGIVFAIGMILVGQAIEGGHVGSILQLTAAMIVFGGTIGAVAVSFPINEFIRGIKMGAGTLTQHKSDLHLILDQVVDLAGVARRDGVLALEQRLPELKDPFLKRAVGFIVREGEQELGKLRSGNYFILNVEPGKHTFTVHSEATDNTTLEVEAGATYFLAGSISMGFLAGHPHLNAADVAAFEAALPKLEPSKPLK